MASKAMVSAPLATAARIAEIEQLLHQRGIVGDGIDHFDQHVADLRGPDSVEINVAIHHQPAVDGLCTGVDRLCDGFRCRSAIGDVVLDAEILVGTAGIVARREDQAPLAPYLRITWLAAGVDKMPPCPTSTRA